MYHKYKYCSPIIMAIVLSALIGTSIARAETPPLLKEIGDRLVGRWMFEITWAIDYPGLGKKGEKATGYDVIRWIADGQAIEGEWMTGETTGRYVIWWDAASKQVRTHGVDSSGRWDQGTISKEGSNSVGTASGCFIDGRRVEYEWKTTYQDNGNTRIVSGATILDGVRNDFRDIYKRVAK